jgi:hypothetical protein
MFLLLVVVLPIVVLSVLLRVVFLPFRIARRFPTRYGYGRPGWGYGRRHRGFRLGGLGTLLTLFAIDRLFNHRRF